MSYVKNYEYGQNEEPETEEVCWHRWKHVPGKRYYSKGSCRRNGSGGHRGKRRGKRRGRRFSSLPSEDEQEAFFALKF